MEKILAQAQKVCEAAELCMITSEEIPVSFEANRLKNIQSKQNTSLSLRIIKNGRIGYAVCSNLEDSAKLIENALETSAFGQKAQFEFPRTQEYPQVDTYDGKVKSVSLETMVQAGEQMISRIRQHTPEIICEAEVDKASVSFKLLNSLGGEASYQLTAYSIGMEGTLVRGTDMLFVGEAETSCHPLADTEEITRSVMKQLELARDNATVPTKDLPVIFTPHGVASALVSPLMSSFNGKTVLEGASPLGDKLGESIFDNKLSLYDNATVGFRPSSRPCDDEAVPSQRTPLIEAGTIKSFLYDLQTAARAKTKSTGNGNRTQRGLTSPSPSAFVFNNGKVSLEEMLADIKEGLVIEHLMGAEQGNILNGDFSGNVLLGYKIENGKITGRLKNTIVSGNVYQLLGEITAIGSDGRWVGSHLYVPSIYCPSLSVAAK